MQVALFEVDLPPPLSGTSVLAEIEKQDDEIDLSLIKNLMTCILCQSEPIDDNNACVNKLIHWWYNARPEQVVEMYNNFFEYDYILSCNGVALINILMNMNPSPKFTRDWSKKMKGEDLTFDRHESLIAYILISIDRLSNESKFDETQIILKFINYFIDMCNELVSIEHLLPNLYFDMVFFIDLFLEKHGFISISGYENKIFNFGYHAPIPGCKTCRINILKHFPITSELLKGFDFITHCYKFIRLGSMPDVMILKYYLLYDVSNINHYIAHYKYDRNFVPIFYIEKIIFDLESYFVRTIMIYIYYIFNDNRTNLFNIFDNVIVSLMTDIKYVGIMDEEVKSLLSFDNYPILRNHFIESLTKNIPQEQIESWKLNFASQMMMQENLVSNHSQGEVDMITSFPLINGGVTFGGGKVNIDCMLKHYFKTRKDFMNCETSLSRIFYENDHIPIPHFWDMSYITTSETVYQCLSVMFKKDWMYKSGMMADRESPLSLLYYIHDECIIKFSDDSLKMGATDALRNVNIRQVSLQNVKQIIAALES